MARSSNCKFLASCVVVPFWLGCYLLAPVQVLNATSNISTTQDFNTVMQPILDQAQQLAEEYQQGRIMKIPIVGIGGCPGVGKTFLAEKLKNTLDARNISAVILKMDDFIKDKQLRKRYKTGWDLRHLDTDMVHQFLSDILKGSKELTKPVLDEVTREKREEMLNLNSVHLILFEGLYTLGSNPPLDFFKYVDFGLYLDGEREEILQWRWGRENQKKNPKTYDEFVKYMNEWIFTDFEQNIAPTRASAHYVIFQDSFHNYKVAKNGSDPG